MKSDNEIQAQSRADRRTNDGDQNGTAREIADGENENVEVAERVHRYI